MPPEKLFANLNYEEHKVMLKDFVNKLISDKKLNISNPTQEIAMDDLIIYNEQLAHNFMQNAPHYQEILQTIVTDLDNNNTELPERLRRKCLIKIIPPS